MITLFSALALFAAPALNDASDVHVVYADLNLSTTAGTAELDRRIDRAIDAACPAATTRFLAEIEAVRTCRAAASERIAAQRVHARSR